MPTCRMFPKDVVVGEIIEMDLKEEHPKSEELCDVLNRNNGGGFDLEYPRIVLERLPHLPIFSLGGLIDERSNVLRLASKEPRRVPEGGLRAVTNDDGGGSIEKVEVLLVAWVSHPHPHLGGILPFIP